MSLGPSATAITLVLSMPWARAVGDDAVPLGLAARARRSCAARPGWSIERSRWTSTTRCERGERGLGGVEGHADQAEAEHRDVSRPRRGGRRRPIAAVGPQRTPAVSPSAWTWAGLVLGASLMNTS